MSQINKHAKTLRDAIDSGLDPLAVELNEIPSGRGKSSGNLDYYLYFLFAFYITHLLCFMGSRF